MFHIETLHYCLDLVNIKSCSCSVKGLNNELWIIDFYFRVIFLLPFFNVGVKYKSEMNAYFIWRL